MEPYESWKTTWEICGNQVLQDLGEPTKSIQDVVVGVYAIAADEPEEFIDRWLESMKGADYIWVLITKKDNPNYTYFKQKQELPEFKDKLFVQEEEIKPWRFDVARNHNLAMVDKLVDVLVCTDIDEVLIEDFWKDLRECVGLHPDFDTIYYKYAWSITAKEEPSRVFWYNKTHQQGIQWKYPVHEILDKPKEERIFFLDPNKIYLIHKPDLTKSRGDYLNLLFDRYGENPDDNLTLFYLIRELVGRNDKKAVELAEKVTKESMRDYFIPTCLNISRSYFNLHNIPNAIYWGLQALNGAPQNRDCLGRLAQIYAYANLPELALQVAGQLWEAPLLQDEWVYDMIYNRNWKFYQICADAYMWQGKYQKAQELLEQAKREIEEFGDIQDAVNQGFYEDWDFLQKHYKKD